MRKKKKSLTRVKIFMNNGKTCIIEDQKGRSFEEIIPDLTDAKWLIIDDGTAMNVSSISTIELMEEEDD